MTGNIRTKLGKKIKHYRNERGLTQEKLAELANIDYKYLQRLEGKNPPAIKIFREIVPLVREPLGRSETTFQVI